MEGNNNLKWSSSHIFNFPLEFVFETYLNRRSFEELSKGVVEKLDFKNGEDYKKVGTQIYFRYTYLNSDIILTVEDIVDKKYYKRVTYLFEYIDFNLSYRMTMHFYWNSLQKNTFHITENIFEKIEHFNYILKYNGLKEQLMFYHMFENYMKKNSKKLKQVESIQIDKSIEKVWQVVTNFNIFKKYVPQIGDVINYDGKSLEKGTKIHIYFNSGEKEHHLKVSKCIEGQNKKLYSLNFYAGKPKSPKQELRFCLIKIDNNSCFLYFEHKFFKFLKARLIHSISKEKKEILNTLKNSFE